jgi:hypothetical protein
LAIALAGPLRDHPSDAQLERVLAIIELSSGPVKDALIEAIARVPGARGADRLVKRLPIFGKATRAKVAEALAGHAAARASLANLLHDTDSAVRANAVWSLGSAGAAVDGAALPALLLDRDLAVAANAVAALARIASRFELDVSATLCAALGDGRSFVRANALTGLRLTRAKCADTGGPAWLLEHDRSDEVRMAAARLIRDQAFWLEQSPLALERCAAKDNSGQVATECSRAAEVTPSEPPESLDVAILVVPKGSREPAARIRFGLVRADGFIRSGLSDRRGSVWEASAPRGALRLTVPDVFAD